MRWEFFHSLRGRLLLLVSLAMLPAIILIVLGVLETRQMVEAGVRRALIDSLSRMQQSFAREMVRTSPDLQLEESLPLDQPEGCRAALRRVLAQDPNYSEVGVATANGQNVCTLVRPGASPTRIDPAWVQAAISKNGRVLAVLSDTPAQSAPQLVVLKALVQHERGVRLLYVTYEASNLATILGMRAGAIPEHARLLLVDPRGHAHTLAGGMANSSPPVPALAFAPVVLQRLLQSGEPLLQEIGAELVAMAALGEHGEVGAVAVAIRRSDLYQGVHTSLRHGALAVLLGFALLLLLLRWITLRLIVRPAAHLMQASAALGRGALDARSGLPTGRDEFSQVAAAFDRMAAEVQQRAEESSRHLIQMERLNRLHEVLASLNEAIHRRTQASRLLQDLCDLGCATGGFSHVWIGEVDTASQRLHVVHWATATPTDFWRDFSVSLDSRDAQGQGYLAEVVRTGKAAGSNHFRTDPRTEAWHERACELDIASSLALPLGFTAHGNHRVLALHAVEEDYFSTGEIRLIEQIAQEAVFGLNLIDIESQLTHSTTHDVITGLPNAQLLMQRMGELMQQAQQARTRLTISVIDVGVQQISNRLGLIEGNLFLTGLGREIEAGLGRGDTLGISPAGRFLLVTGDISNLDETADHLAARVLELQAISAAANANSPLQKITVGVAVYPDDGENVDGLFDKALAALDLAEQNHVGGIRFFSAHTNRVLQENRQLLQLLHGAIERGELALHYQPIVSLKTRKLHGFEALLRWTHPTLGSIPPDRFIPLAEGSGLIHEIGDWVVRQVLAQAAVWNSLVAHDIYISLNVSAVQLNDPDFSERVGRMLDGNHAPADRVQLAMEVTESHLIGDIERSVRLLKRLSSLGFAIVLDDFGTGYSSLSYLYRLPLNVLKIDQSFITNVASESLARQIVQGIQALAQSLGLETVVEGVEEVDQQQVLESLGCNYAQGFLYDRALPAAEAQRRWLGLSV